jgi:hypothetical protein
MLLVLVVGGIGAIALALHLLGLSERKVFVDAHEAGAVWDSEFPDAPVRHGTLSDDRHAALIDTKGGQRGVVWPMGADATARYLSGAKITKTKNGLNIRLPDFTAPRISLRLGEGEVGKWAETGGGAA